MKKKGPLCSPNTGQRGSKGDPGCFKRLPESTKNKEQHKFRRNAEIVPKAYYLPHKTPMTTKTQNVVIGFRVANNVLMTHFEQIIEICTFSRFRQILATFWSTLGLLSGAASCPKHDATTKGQLRRDLCEHSKAHCLNALLGSGQSLTTRSQRLGLGLHPPAAELMQLFTELTFVASSVQSQFDSCYT